MTDERLDARPFGSAEPDRDRALGALLAEVVGRSPVHDVDWPALAARIASARQRNRSSWWAYATRWERRAVPVALAAGLVGVLALWGLGMPATARVTVATVADPIAALFDGTPVDDAARSFARSATGAGDPTLVELY